MLYTIVNFIKDVIIGMSVFMVIELIVQMSRIERMNEKEQDKFFGSFLKGEEYSTECRKIDSMMH